MASRLVYFGSPGAEGPPGVVNVPDGRGVLAYANGTIFGIPAPDGSADGVTVLAMDPNSAEFYKLPKIPDPGTEGYILQWEDSEQGYTLRPPPAEFPSGTGLVGSDAGTPVVYPFGGAGDGAIPRVIGTSIAFSQLFNAKGIVIAAANGSHSYLQAQGIVYTAADGTVYNLTVGPDLRINGSNLETVPTEVARLSGGKTLAANARGKTDQAGNRVESASSFNITQFTSGTAPTALLATITGVSIGDIIEWDACWDHDSSAAVAMIVEMTSSNVAGAGTIYSTMLLNCGTNGAVHERWNAVVAGTYYVHIRAHRWGSGAGTPAFNVTRRRITWKINKD